MTHRIFKVKSLLHWLTVICPGKRTYALADRVRVIPLERLADADAEAVLLGKVP